MIHSNLVQSNHARPGSRQHLAGHGMLHETLEAQPKYFDGVWRFDPIQDLNNRMAGPKGATYFDLTERRLNKGDPTVAVYPCAGMQHQEIELDW